MSRELVDAGVTVALQTEAVRVWTERGGTRVSLKRCMLNAGSLVTWQVWHSTSRSVPWSSTSRCGDVPARRCSPSSKSSGPMSSSSERSESFAATPASALRSSRWPASSRRGDTTPAVRALPRAGARPACVSGGKSRLLRFKTELGDPRGLLGVVIDAPSEFVDTLKNSVDLVRWESYADMTEDLLDRLARDAVDQAREAVSTAGYFTTVIDVDVDRTTDPIAITLRVKPGMPTRITDVVIDVNGPAVSDGGAGAAAVAQVTQNWGLPKGAIFRQSAWDRAKVRAVATLIASPYAAAKIYAHSLYELAK